MSECRCSVLGGRGRAGTGPPGKVEFDKGVSSTMESSASRSVIGGLGAARG